MGEVARTPEMAVVEMRRSVMEVDVRVGFMFLVMR
jgi:hypothetical protein